MSDMEKSYSFHSVIIPASHIVTVECFINEGCTTKIIATCNVNISNVTGFVDGVVTLQ